MTDAVVVGAGPAGAFAATLLAREGMEVVLVDRARFPRWTVCGACLSGFGVRQLQAEGLGGLLDRMGAVTLTRMELQGWGREARLSLPGGRVLSRARLDAALVEEARRVGVRVLTETRARLGRWTGHDREVELVGPEGSPVVVRARMVVAATGLHTLPRVPGAGEGPPVEHDAGSRVGAGSVVTDWDDGPPAGTVRMTVGEGGYVGQTRQEDGRWVVAGALDRRWIQARGGPGPAVEALLKAEGRSAGWTVVEGWRGTPSLTRRLTRRADPGVFYLGDAAGYVEPFTGEGMGWALRGARALRDVGPRAVAGWSPGVQAEWDRRYLDAVVARQRLCRGVAWLGRRPSLARGAIHLLSRAPTLARPALRRVAGLGFRR